MALEATAQVEVDRARPMRHRVKPKTPNFRPLSESISAVDTPQRMKTKESIMCAVTSRNSFVLCRPLCSKCLAPYTLKMLPAQRLAMIPERPDPSAAAKISHALATMYSVSGMVFPGSLATRSSHTRRDAKTIPKTAEPSSSVAMSARQWTAVSSHQLPLIVWKSTMATASLITDSPKIMVWSKGSDASRPSLLKVERVATGSTAEMSAANARFSRRVVTTK
mmetsp:Transcript_16978/g.51119  ORF Transcript_16978/g.51119 Transcript_16978/m.51119 type:complete len:222 (-) Transcript_16978:8-673(-)